MKLTRRLDNRRPRARATALHWQRGIGSTWACSWKNLAALSSNNLGELLEQLHAGGVEVIQGPESHENGKFAGIMDPDENKIDLWEPKVWDDENKGA